MAKKKTLVEENIVRIKKAIEDDKIILGTKEVQIGLRNNSVKEVFLASNCPEDVRADIEVAGKINKIDVTVLNKANDELGVVCKKPFSIAVLAVKK